MTMTRRSTLATVLAFAWLLTAGIPENVLAEDSAVTAAKKRGRLVVGVKFDYPPYGFVNEKKEVVGFEPDMARELAHYLLGDRNAIEFVEVTSANRIPFLVTGKIDIILATMTITAERAKTIAFSDPYYNGGITILVANGNSDIQQMADLKDKRVIVTQGSTSDVVVSKLSPAPRQIIKLVHITECFSALQGSRGDAFVQDVTILKPFADRTPGFKIVGGLYNEEVWGIGARKEDREAIEWVNGSLKRLRESGTYDALLKRWFGQ